MRKGYRAQPLKRVYIPKKKGKRPHGIPVTYDRAMQALYLLALDPISETTADNCSYSFRPKRGCADAIAKSFTLLAKKNGAEWILEGDFKAKLFVNGKEIPEGDKFRYGIEYDVEGKSKLIVYLEAQYTKTTFIEIQPVKDSK